MDDSNNIRIAKNTLFLTIRFGIVLLLSLYTTRVLLNALGVVDYGVYSVVCGFVSMFAFLNTSMNNGIQRFYNYQMGLNTADGITQVYRSALIIQASLAFLVLLFTETIGQWYMLHHLVIPPERLVAAQWVFHSACLSLAFLIMQVPYSAIIMAEEHMNYFAIVSVVDAVLKLAIVLLLPLFAADHLKIYGILFASISIIDFLLYFVYAKTHFHAIHWPSNKSNSPLKDILGFSGWNIFGTFASMMREQGIDVLMNLFFGPIVNAARGVANQINNGIQSLISNMNTAIRPQVIKSYAASEFERTLKLTFASSKLSCIVLYLVSVPIILEIDFILHIWLGDTIPDHTAGLLVVIICTWFINNLNYAVSGVIHASGKMMVYQVATSIITLCGLPAAYLAMRAGASPEWGLSVVTGFVLLMQIASLYIMKTVIHYRIWDYCKQIILPLFCMMILSFPIIWYVHTLISEGWVRLIIITILSTICILPIAYWLVLNSNEKEISKKLFLKFIHK